MTVQKPYVTLDIFDHNRKKLCGLYDSKTQAKGQAHDIFYTNNISGLKTVTFTLPHLLDKKRNFRWNCIRSEYLLRQKMDDYTDWFIVHAPKKTRDSRATTNTVSCDHISTILKTKNLYLTFDDTNGIGSIQYLLEQILKGTGWTLGVCDTFYERDGKTEKVRSLQSESKSGAYKLITDVCNLFKAYPVFHGETKTVDILSLNNKGKMFEMTMGKDIDSLSVQFDSEDIITRLYVEGEYSEHGYVGIDDVNPTGLSYLMNFDYYKSIGMFTDDHQTALDTYYERMGETIAVIRDAAARAGEKEDTLNNLWGQINYVLYPVENGEIQKKIAGGTVTVEQLEISQGDALTILTNDGKYRKETAGTNGSVGLSASDTHVIKFITLPSALIGSKEVAIESKEKLIKNIQSKITDDLTEERKADYSQQIEKYMAEIEEIYAGNNETEGLYTMMHRAVGLCMDLNEIYYERETALIEQENVEADFHVAMGDMLKEGYWQCSHYAPGQEEFLYEDAVDMMDRIAWPSVKYQVDRVSLAGKFKYKSTDIDINIKVHVYDPELSVNDVLFVSGYSYCLDNSMEDTVELSNDDITITGVTFDSILSRMTRLADQIDQKNALYERAEAITPDGSIYMERLEGAINVLKNQLSSTVSSWYTDSNGNIIFENTTGKSAMMLTGDGFMIASGKIGGEWDWRTFGTGEGFTADAIITGYLSADRIEARSITANKLSSDVGQTLDLSSNQAITSKVSRDEMTAAVAGKADSSWVTERLESLISQTEKDITFSFNQSKEFVIEATGPFQSFIEEVKTYQRFSADGLELGKLNSPFLTRLSNEKLSFVQDGAEVAYIQHNKLYITEAQISEKFSIGKDSYGFFDWIMTDKGLGVKWRK